MQGQLAGVDMSGGVVRDSTALSANDVVESPSGSRLGADIGTGGSASIANDKQFIELRDRLREVEDENRALLDENRHLREVASPPVPAISSAAPKAAPTRDQNFDNM